MTDPVYSRSQNKIPMTGRGAVSTDGLFARKIPLSMALLLIVFAVQLSARASTLAYWRFEPGDMGADSSGNNNVLTVNNITSSSNIATNAPGTGSAVFDGSTSSAVTTSLLQLSNYNALTIECFIKTNGQSSLGMLYEHSPDVNVSPGGFYFDFNELSQKVVISQLTTGYATQVTPYPTNDSSWHHYAVTIDETGANVRFQTYIDGVLQTNIIGSVAPSHSFRDDLFYIGARAQSLFFFNGGVDEMRISSKVLPPSGFLISPALTNASISISQPPTNTTIIQNTPATFTVGATLQNGDQQLLEYQWRTNGVDIPGAVNSTFTIPQTGLEYDGVQVSVMVSVQSVGGVTPVTSSDALFTVQPDIQPPVALSAYAQANTMVGVTFEPLNPASANDPNSYSFDGGVTVQSAQLLPDGKTVVIVVSPLPNATHTLNYTVTDLAGNVGTGMITVTNAGFISEDIGGGSGMVISTNSSSFTASGTWGDIWGASDNFNFIYKSFTGDFDVRLQMQDVIGSGNGSIRGGLMAREDNSPESRNIFMASYVRGNDNWVSTLRTVAGGGTAVTSGALIPHGAGFSYPNAWVRLTRVGQTFSAYFSTNNVDWTLYGASMVASPAYPDTILVGAASESVDSLSSATFQYGEFVKFSLTNGTIVINSSPTNTTTESFHPATFTVSATLQGSSDQSLLGYQWMSNGVTLDGENTITFTIPQAAPDANGAQIRCLVSAPGIAPVPSDTAILTVAPDTNAPAVLYAYSPDSLHVVVGFDDFLDPNIANDPSLYSLNGGFVVNSAQVQADGKSVLLAVSGLNSPTFQVTLNGVTDLSGNPANASIGGSSGGLTMVDINNGFLIPAQIVAVSSNGFTVNAAGQDIFGPADSFNFVYQSLTNDFDVSVRFVNSGPLQNGSQRGGLMVRQDFSQGSPNVFVGTYAPGGANLWVMTERTTQDAATGINAIPGREPGFDFPNAWLRLKRSGQAITGYESRDGVNWVELATTTDVPLPSVVLVGMASTTISTLASDFQYSDYGPTAIVPELQIQLSGANVVLRWSSGASGFDLQQRSSLSSGTWTPVLDAPVQSGGYNEVTLPTTNSATFFRLSQ